MKFMKKISLFLVFSLAFVFSISAQENTPSKNWFVGVGANANVYLYKDAWKESKVLQKPTLGGELFVGKWFSGKFGARLNLAAGSMQSWYDKAADDFWFKSNFGLARLDLMLDFTNLFRSYSPDRFYSLIPHVGVGGAYAFNPKVGGLKVSPWDNNKDTYASLLFGGGLLNTFRLSRVVSIYVDLKMDVVNSKFDVQPIGGSSSKFNGLLSPSIGLVFNLGKAKAAPVVAPVIEEVAPPVQQQQETPPPPPPAPKPQPQPQPQPQPVVAPAPYPYNVFFRIGKSVVDADQQANIANTAKYMNDNPTTKVKIVGYADKGTGSAAVNLKLSEQRAKAVAKVLVDKYKISSDRISVDWKGDTVQPFSVNKQNRVAIILGN